ncbi:MAG: heavy-metal-associated domain-containing protein [Saprospiraceae bacterium]|nr:heavy-metal-associated domain-containing protein [Saprospiraceae bacterium]MBK7221188.1 heavy-metal-associated domain-containing protein [Saprospiraceae bacterium]MBK7789985.1 heavy-metal-associated domain-containing protein [Saprospiraceae bacterium]MBK8110200.1 heavy-metal-associated domain-containing protein [Saprospiraceae bacterium]MBK8850728.1 heavy-metal-associated domain-containing protein [Saprospiraceae bacterium]
MIHTIEVENIKCGGCMNTIRQAIGKIEGVKGVEIEENKTTIHIEAETDRGPLVEKLASLGYPELGNNNLLHQAKSFVSCAIGRMSDPVE